jgi:hypothetical protein
MTNVNRHVVDAVTVDLDQGIGAPPWVPFDRGLAQENPGLRFVRLPGPRVIGGAGCIDIAKGATLNCASSNARSSSLQSGLSTDFQIARPARRVGSWHSSLPVRALSARFVLPPRLRTLVQFISPYHHKLANNNRTTDDLLDLPGLKQRL